MSYTENSNCVQCQSEMSLYFEIKPELPLSPSAKLFVCFTASCPNFNLLQPGLLPKENET